MGKVTRLFCGHQDFVHKELSAPALGLYTCGKTLKMCLKSEFKEIWNLQQMVEMIRAFCWHQKFVPKGFSALALGLYRCIKSLKMCINQISKRSFWNLQHMGKEKKPVCCHNFLFQMGCLPLPAWGYYIHVKKPIKIGKKSDFKEICFKLATHGQSDKEFLLTSKFCPQGVVCVCPGAIYINKII